VHTQTKDDRHRETNHESSGITGKKRERERKIKRPRQRDRKKETRRETETARKI